MLILILNLYDKKLYAYSSYQDILKIPTIYNKE